MDAVLLATKVRIPPLVHRVLPRTRLIDALESGISHHKLILLSSPAGYGKTTLLSQWAIESQYQVVWLSLDETDGDLERFINYLLAAWEAVQPEIMEGKLGVLLGSRMPDNQTVLSEIINAAADLPQQMAIVLDDYHLIEDSSIHEALAYLLDHLPHTMCFILATRAEPPLPLARYRAKRALLELGIQDLQFVQQETAEFLTEMMGLDLAQDEVSSIQNRLEGWIVGLQLTALAWQHHGGNGGELVTSGKHRFIADYLRDDVLAHIPDTMEHFLLQTSILDRLCGSLCDAVTEAENSQQMVEALEAGNLFLLPLDNQREWFRYHHLFADFLYQELRRRHPDDVADLHRRAAHWHLAHDLPDQAFAHTVRAEDGDIMQEIFERHFIPKLLRGEIRTLQLWLESMPDAWHTRYPIIGLARAATLMFSGQFEAATHFLDEIEHQTLVGRKDRRWQLARVTALRCFMACRRNELTRAEALADDALKDLRKEDVSLRLDIFGALGDTYRKGGHWQKAQASYLNVLDFSHAPTFHIQSVHVYGALADLEMRQGHLHNADGYWREALATIQTHKTWGEGGYPLPLIGWVYIRLGELLYEWNNLPTAWDHLSRGLEHAEMGGDVRAMIAGYLIGGRFKLTQGDLEAAESYLEQARPLVERAQFSHWFSRFERFQLEVWLAGDRLRAAVNWSDKMLDDDTITQRPESEIAQLAMARVLIVKGNTESISRALTLLDRLLVTSSEEGRTHITIEALALRALADWERGDTPATFTSLERALRLAEPEGHIRLFADLGLPMARLLQEALVRELMPEYAGELLAAFQETAQTKLPEPLTNREREILGLIAAGLTNREIGAVLVISPQTVKKHAGSIYDKLGVNNRTQAAARARELQLRD